MNLFKALTLLCLSVSMLGTAHPSDKYKHGKQINKTYTVDSNAAVVINNSFGNVTIELWDINKVSIDVNVEVTGDDEKEVLNRLEMIDVKFQSTRSQVSAVSDIPSTQRGIMSWISGSSHTSTTVDYVVKMPRLSPLDLTNHYGAVIIPKMVAMLKLDCDFGRLEIGQLLHEQNDLSFDYTDHSHIDYFKGGSIAADFSKFKIYGADGLDFKGDYTTMELGIIKTLKYNSDFSTINVKEVDRLDGRGDYAKVIIDRIKSSGMVKADFGSFSIKELNQGFKKLDIKSDYTTLKVNYDQEAQFQYECKTEFGSLSLDKNLSSIISTNEMNEKYRKGYHINPSALSSIMINSSFGNVTFKSNN